MLTTNVVLAIAGAPAMRLRKLAVLRTTGRLLFAQQASEVIEHPSNEIQSAQRTHA